MIATGTNEEILKEIAKELGFNISTSETNGRVRFTLRVSQGEHQYRKMNPRDERKTSSVCFHGHYEFFKRLFQTSPDAKVSSSRYGPVSYTAETLRENAQEFGRRRLGPPYNVYHEYQVRDCCYCAMDDPNPGGIY